MYIIYIIFFISAQNIDCGNLLELSRRSGSSQQPQSMCNEFLCIHHYVGFTRIYFIFFAPALHIGCGNLLEQK